ncbi:MAG TPA: PQQ-binding-like beta-propeller repeat protein [Anaerolineales bacterium]|nr:PQQ-binding-like beta-propeller repeat protein [Anaerolineales bacterium]
MSKKILFLSVALLAVILLSACSGAPVSGNTWPGLAASDDAAYLANGTFVYAVNLQNGTELWHYPAERDSGLLFFATPYVTQDGLVIVGSSGSDYSLVALNPAVMNTETNSPTEAWRFTGAQDTWVAAPLAIDNRLFAPNSDGNLYVFDLSDGQTDKQPIKVVELEGDLWSQPVTDGQSIFLSSLEHSVFAVDKDSYEVIWREDLGSAITSPPVLATDGYLYVGSFASQLEKFDPASGDHQSVGETKDWVWGTPGSVEDNLYFGDLSGNFYAYNLEQAAYDWESVIPGNESIKAITASPLALNEILLVATEAGVIYEVDQDGDSRLWTQPGGKIYTSPLAAGDLVLVSPMNADAILYAYDVNGRQAWSFKPEN